MAAADREGAFGRNNWRAGLEAYAVLHDAGLGPGVPNIGHRAGEQRPGLAPISPVVIDYFADRPRPDRLDDRAGRNPLGRPIDRSAPRRTGVSGRSRAAAVHWDRGLSLRKSVRLLTLIQPSVIHGPVTNKGSSPGPRSCRFAAGLTNEGGGPAL